jgi:opacity protein-like surface antigen
MTRSTYTHTLRHSVVVALATVLFSTALPSRASAAGFVSPFLGYNFGGDAGCPEITNCDNKNLNWGVGLGALGAVVGFELEFGYSPKFFGESAGYSSDVLTLMGNLMLAPRLGIVQPYALVGAGLIKWNADLSPSGLLDNSNSDFGYDVGGGLMVFFGTQSHVGLRGDVRYFHSFNAREIIGLNPGEDKLDFGRFSGAIVFRF